MLLGLFGAAAVATDGRVVSRALGAVQALLRVVTASDVIDQEAELPLGQLEGTFGAHKPRAGEGAEALAEGAESAHVVAAFGDASGEDPTL